MSLVPVKFGTAMTFSDCFLCKKCIPILFFETYQTIPVLMSLVPVMFGTVITISGLFFAAKVSF